VVLQSQDFFRKIPEFYLDTLKDEKNSFFLLGFEVAYLDGLDKLSLRGLSPF